MTVVIYRDGVMAADSGAWENDILVSTEHQKIYRLVDGSLLGLSGDDRDMQLFLGWMMLGRPEKRPTVRGGHCLGAIHVDPKGVVMIYDDHWQSFVDTADWSVLGVHREFVHGLLAAGLSAVAAVNAAIERCPHAAGRVISARLDAFSVADKLAAAE